ncbi:RICIN domain-containing protein [Shimia sp. Alg240-R146]|uniref:RICIN domain-containing protein n=1 Tax=Shimia sp. Alg240-R146 TaxID=2993449 RepID=UPI0022E397C4|nr:RICIN domain-containing protein [Shimia sp. Alg240-R146]
MSASAEEVEIYLVDMLDNIQSGYCVDIAGGKGASADPANGLQGHTCYSPLGGLLVDQIFETDRFADGQLYMPKFDVCAQIDGVEVGATVSLAACDGSSKQSFVFSGDGVITPASAQELCLTVGEDTRFGRSKQNQIKAMTLQTCDADLATHQTWAVRTGL